MQYCHILYASVKCKELMRKWKRVTNKSKPRTHTLGVMKKDTLCKICCCSLWGFSNLPSIQISYPCGSSKSSVLHCVPMQQLACALYRYFWSMKYFNIYSLHIIVAFIACKHKPAGNISPSAFLASSSWWKIVLGEVQYAALPGTTSGINTGCFVNVTFWARVFKSVCQIALYRNFTKANR